MAEIVYILCAVMSLLCTLMLYRGYRRNRTKMLLWSSLSFGFFAVNNVFLFIDMGLLPDVDLHGPFWRSLLSAIAGVLLLFGLIWELA